VSRGIWLSRIKELHTEVYLFNFVDCPCLYTLVRKARTRFTYKLLLVITERTISYSC